VALAAEFLGALGVVPDLGLFQCRDDFGQAIPLASVVKDTSADLLNATPGRPTVLRGR
jgi:hypothetical protein